MAHVAMACPTRCLHVLQLAMDLITTLLYNVLRSTLMLVKRRPKSLEGDVALITGAGEDLGRELAYKLNEEGCKIICVDSDAINCEETAFMINQRNFERGISHKAHSYHYDIRDQNQVAELARRVYAQHDHIDILINNTSKLGDQQYILDSISVSLHSHFWTILAFLPGMLKRSQGHIVTVMPSAALTGSKATHYARKNAVQGLLDKLAQEMQLDARFIKLTNVQPYVLESTESLMVPELKAETAAEEIVHAVKYELCSISTPRNAFIWQSVMNSLPEDTTDVWRDAFNSRRFQVREAMPTGWGPP